MERLDDDIVPEHARDVKADAGEFARERIAPEAEAHFRPGEYPWDVLEAGQTTGLVAQDIPEKWEGQDSTWPRCSRSRRTRRRGHHVAPAAREFRLCAHLRVRNGGPV